MYLIEKEKRRESSILLNKTQENLLAMYVHTLEFWRFALKHQLPELLHFSTSYLTLKNIWLNSLYQRQLKDPGLVDINHAIFLNLLKQLAPL